MSEPGGRWDPAAADADEALRRSLAEYQAVAEDRSLHTEQNFGPVPLADGAVPPPPASVSASPTASATPGGFAPGPRVTCPGPGRVVSTDTEREPDEPRAGTPAIALKRFVEQSRSATRDPRYDLRYFSPIELPAHLTEKQRSEAARFAGYRANDSIFVILNLQRYNAESGWVQGTIETCTQPRRLPA